MTSPLQKQNEDQFKSEHENKSQRTPCDNAQVLDLEEEPPLSPVLTSSVVDKKLLKYKRKTRAKGKLNNKFNSHTVLISKLEQNVPSVSAPDVTAANILNQGDCNIINQEISAGDKIRRIKELEKNFDKFYDDLEKTDEFIKSEFKKSQPCLTALKSSPVAEENVTESTETIDISFTQRDSLCKDERMLSILEVDKLSYANSGEKISITSSSSDLQNAECSEINSNTTSKDSIILDDEEISDSQMIEAARSAEMIPLQNSDWIKEDFKGFAKQEIEKSKENLQTFRSKIPIYVSSLAFDTVNKQSKFDNPNKDLGELFDKVTEELDRKITTSKVRPLKKEINNEPSNSKAKCRDKLETCKSLPQVSDQNLQIDFKKGSLNIAGNAHEESANVAKEITRKSPRLLPQNNNENSPKLKSMIPTPKSLAKRSHSFEVEKIEKNTIALAKRSKSTCSPRALSPETISPKIDTKILKESSKQSSYIGGVHKLETATVKAEKGKCLEVDENVLGHCSRGFTTANGSPIKISKEALTKAKSLFDDIDANVANKPDLNEKTKHPEGFSTGSGKLIHVSKSSIKKAQSLFNNIDDNSKNTNKVRKQSQSSENITKLRKESFEKPESILDSTEENENVPTKIENNANIETANHTGFQTGAGEAINISNEKLIKAQKLFENIDDSQEVLLIKPPNSNKNIKNKKEETSGGFQTGSGKAINISKESLKKAQILYDSVEDNHNASPSCSKGLGKTGKKSLGGFQTGAGKSISINKASIKKVQNLFDGIEVDENVSFSKPSSNNKNVTNTEEQLMVDFQTGTGKSINVSKESLRKSQTLLDDIEENENKSLNNFPSSNKYTGETAGKPLGGFQTGTGKSLKVSNESLRKAQTLFDGLEKEENFSLQNYVAICSSNKVKSEERKLFDSFQTKLGKAINVSKEILSNTFRPRNKQPGEISKDDSKNTANLLDMESEDLDALIKETEKIEANFLKTRTFKQQPTESGSTAKMVINMDDLLNDSSMDEPLLKLSDHICRIDRSPPRKKQKVDNFSEKQSQHAEENLSNSAKNSPKTKSLNSIKKRSLGGLKNTKKIEISQKGLEKAKNLFEDIDLSDLDGSFNMSQNNTPEKGQGPMQSSTPLQNFVSKRQRNLAPIETNLTPIKEIPEPSDVSDSTQKSGMYIRNPRKRKRGQIVFQQRACSNIDEWEQNMKNSFEEMKQKLLILGSRIEAAKYQKRLIESGSVEHRRPYAGRLYKIRTNKMFARIMLKDATKGKFPECHNEDEAELYEISREILDVTPRNATEVNFYSAWTTNCKNDLPVLNCEDGAIVIPSSDDMIGYVEIENAFKAMQGVDPSLLPENWISNHFRWIVWKLSGMERTLPHTFKGCLSVDNILQQLKYRYDREIDHVQRSALRRILETDDVAQKRLVLCVSGIYKLSINNYELELTDGWYKIRTLIDVPLMKQVNRKVKIGIKLMISGAELLNCNGCSPLEVPGDVRLKINYNSTRRARWDAKLGYQRNPTPFPVSLKSAHTEGGAVKCAKCYIARIYPLKYMEKLKNGGTIWRNVKAEDKRCASWEIEKQEKIEKMHLKMQEEMRAKKTSNFKNITSKSIRQMSVQEVQEINCPEMLTEMLELTADPDSLREMLSPSQQAALLKYQSEGSFRKEQQLSKMLKEQIQKENFNRDVVSVLKVLIFDSDNLEDKNAFVLSIWRPNQDQLDALKEGKMAYIYNILPKTLSTFSSISQTRFEILKEESNFGNRTVNTISEIFETKKIAPRFGEFDTVGLTVKVNVQNTVQELWLVDSNHKFLYVRIAEGPHTCSLLDGIEPGKCVAMCNLTYRSPEKKFGRAIADHYSTLSCYPHEAYLKDALDKLCSELPKDLKIYLDDCTERIETLSAILNQLEKSVNRLPIANTISTGYDDSVTLARDADDDDISFSDEGTLLMSKLSDVDVAMSLINTQQYRT